MPGRLPEGDFHALINRARDSHLLSDIVGRHTDLKKRGSRELVGLCPFHSERTPSFEVNNDKGTFHCHGCGVGGDAITFLTEKEGLAFIDAVKLLLGDEFPVISEEERTKRKQAEDRDRTARIDMARAIWAKATPAQDTPAEVYARSRGITMVLPPTIRFVMTPRWRNTETGEVGRDVPAMVCAVQERDGPLVGVQCIFLDDGGRRKYERKRPDGTKAKAKLSLGIVAGGALRLGPAAEQIVLCEGPEDGLTLAQQMPDRAVWVSCGTAMLSRLELPDQVRSLMLAGDNNLAGHQAVAEAHVVFSSSGREVAEVFPDPAFLDWNDQLRGIRK